MAFFSYDTVKLTKTPQQYCAEIADFLSANRDAWTQGVMARNQNGCACDAEDKGARQWCALGLIEKFTKFPDIGTRCARLLSRVITPINDRSPRSAPAYNDAPGRTVDDVIAMFRCASYLPTLEEDERAPMMMMMMEDQPLPDQVWAELKTSAQQILDQLDGAKAEALVPSKPVIAVPNWHDIILNGAFTDLPKEMLPHLGKEPMAA